MDQFYSPHSNMFKNDLDKEGTSENKSLSDQYHKFINDYLKLGHKELIPENEIDVPASFSFYLPHHPVPNKNGDKFHVVFDGSAKSSSGVSLNDKLMVGPQLQTALTTLLLSFRTHKIAITADIEKMYRLTRITYGTASALYLAIKCFQQLALNEANNFPLASKAALNDFYVDDLMSGANSLSQALELQNQLTQMLSSTGLVLRKWPSNCNELLNSIDSDMHLSIASLNIDNDDIVKTLGCAISQRHQNSTILVRRFRQPVSSIGFSNASEKVYAAAIYCRSVSDTGKINVQLIIDKTRVAPQKPASLPRLELCGALLLVKLMDFTCKALNYPISQIQFHTDSTIVLSWIGSHASGWKTFVANRETDSSVPSLNDAVPEERTILDKIGARDVIRHLIRKCIKCCKVRVSITNQMTSDLPSSRISPAFMRCGVDYAGPF
ncbi:integrase catalytic domain-containing protein [Trichonephila clavipes]|nr:integrase catalytic domain-containing protein [Trichonephila clavipes]